MLATFLLASLAAATPPSAAVPEAAPIACTGCSEWNAPQRPFRLYGNSWYVGPHGLASVLIDTGAGLVLIDGALPQSAAQIAANIHALGFDPREVRWILDSHAHFDHAGGIAALQRMSGARVAASARSAAGLRAGMAVADDPQAGFGGAMRFPPVPAVVTVADGASIALGDVVITAHHTPGHTPGATSWTWRSCEGARCIDMVYADSLTAVSAPGFRFGAAPARVAAFRRSIATVAALPCDLLVTTHPGASRLFARLAARDAGDRDALLDRNACRACAAAAMRGLDARLRQETAGD